MKQSAANRRKPKKKSAIAESRVKPEIYVKTVDQRYAWRTNYARAEIRVKSGKYQYLQWRDGETVRSLYLGTKRSS